MPQRSVFQYVPTPSAKHSSTHSAIWTSQHFEFAIALPKLYIERTFSSHALSILIATPRFLFLACARMCTRPLASLPLH